jgi:excinuclease UvrABC ATPase subunit
MHEMYSAFLQGFMPRLSRPDAQVLEGLTTAIVVDQQRMGGEPNSRVGTTTEANAMLRIPFSRLGAAHWLAPGVGVQHPLGTRWRLTHLKLSDSWKES